MPPFNPARNITPAFLDQVFRWIDQNGEVMVVLRYLHTAGCRDLAVCKRQTEFETLIQYVPAATDIVVFRDPPFYKRGVVDQEFIAGAMADFSDNQEYILIELETRSGAPTCVYEECNSSKELLASLMDLKGVDIAIGKRPAYWEPDSDTMISAAKDGIDGAR